MDPVTDLLDRLAPILARTGEDGGPAVVRLRDAPEEPDGVELGLRRLAGHPAEALVGFVAPDDWLALGVIAPGWGAPLAGPGDTQRAPSTHPARVRALVVLIVGREGQQAGCTVLSDGRTIDEPPTAGLLVDVLHRCLGLPTAPPGAPVAALLDALWVRDVMAVARVRPPCWRDAVLLHPGLLLAGCAPPPALPAGALLAEAREAAGGCDWSDLRWLAVEGRWPHTDLPPVAAAWMDDGMFARWELGYVAPAPVGVREAARALPAPLARRLRQALRAAGEGPA